MTHQELAILYKNEPSRNHKINIENLVDFTFESNFNGDYESLLLLFIKNGFKSFLFKGEKSSKEIYSNKQIIFICNCNLEDNLYHDSKESKVFYSKDYFNGLKCKIKFHHVYPKHFISYIDQQIRLNDSFYCKDCYYKALRNPNSPLYYSDEAIRRRNTDYSKMGIKGLNKQNSMLEKDEFGNYKNNSEEAINFREKIHKRSVKCAENMNNKLWNNPLNKENQEKCLNSLKLGFKSVKKAWEKDSFGVYINNDKSSLSIRNNAIKNVGTKIKFCQVCNKETLHNGRTCCVCHPEVLNRLFGGEEGRLKCLDDLRKSFYNKGNKLINLYDNSNNGEISIDNLYFSDETTNNSDKYISKFSYLDNIPGVWAIWDKDLSICFDIAQTSNIGEEMRKYFRRLIFNKGLSDQELINENKRYKYNRRKFRDIMKEANNKVSFVIISKNIDSKNKRELIEAQYAYESKAKFWNFAPGQKSKIECLIKENGGT